MSAEQFGQRQLGALGLEVPKRDVEGRNGLSGQATTAHGGASPQQFVEDFGDVIRIFAEQVGRDFLGVGIHARATGAF
ncbi:hypothetical protein D3C75_1083330 [compost metagenome]